MRSSRSAASRAPARRRSCAASAGDLAPSAGTITTRRRAAGRRPACRRAPGRGRRLAGDRAVRDARRRRQPAARTRDARRRCCRARAFYETRGPDPRRPGDPARRHDAARRHAVAAASAGCWRWRWRSSAQPRLLVLDEPTAAIGVAETAAGRASARASAALRDRGAAGDARHRPDVPRRRPHRRAAPRPRRRRRSSRRTRIRTTSPRCWPAAPSTAPPDAS